MTVRLAVEIDARTGPKLLLLRCKATALIDITETQQGWGPGHAAHHLSGKNVGHDLFVRATLPWVIPPSSYREGGRLATVILDEAQGNDMSPL
ncbi:MAG: hypothetical protein M3198_03380 [Actinomycetota bacterium]|nr:hypothetical protein [Actinomycetota bacterium]